MASPKTSQAMLSVLMRRHPTIAAVHPMEVREELFWGTFTPGECGWVFLDGAVELTPSSARRTTSSPGSPTSASRAMTGQSTLRGSASLTPLLANGRLHASVTGRSPRGDWTGPVDYAKQAVKLVAPGGPSPRTRNELSTTAAADRGRRPHPGLRPPSLRRNARTARSSSVWS